MEKKGLDNSAIDSNAWLAGFLDTDGNFSISLSKRTKKHLDKVVPYMRLEIKQTYHRTSSLFEGPCPLESGTSTASGGTSVNTKASLLDNNSSFYYVGNSIFKLNLNSRNRLIDAFQEKNFG